MEQSIKINHGSTTVFHIVHHNDRFSVIEVGEGDDVERGNFASLRFAMHTVGELLENRACIQSYFSK